VEGERPRPKLSVADFGLHLFQREHFGVRRQTGSRHLYRKRGQDLNAGARQFQRSGGVNAGIKLGQAPV
jgi:hypothetical protein